MTYSNEVNPKFVDIEGRGNVTTIEPDWFRQSEDWRDDHYPKNRRYPLLLDEILNQFTVTSLEAQQAIPFDTKAAIACLKRHVGARVIGVDIGGGKAVATVQTVIRGAFTTSAILGYLESRDGDGYLDFLRKIARNALETSLPVALYVGAKLDGSRLVRTSHMGKLYNELKREYDGDFARIFPSGVVVNDAVAGMAGMVIASGYMMSNENTILLIVGGGLGGSVLKDGHIWTTEHGRIEATEEFDWPGSKMRRGDQPLYLKHVVPITAGVEADWEAFTGQRADGRKITRLVKQGDQLAEGLLTRSAWGAAHAVIGIGRAFDLFQKTLDTSVFIHGGGSAITGYTERIRCILQNHLGYRPPIFQTEYYNNACLLGAGTLGLFAAEEK